MDSAKLDIYGPNYNYDHEEAEEILNQFSDHAVNNHPAIGCDIKDKVVSNGSASQKSKVDLAEPRPGTSAQFFVSEQQQSKDKEIMDLTPSVVSLPISHANELRVEDQDPPPFEIPASVSNCWNRILDIAIANRSLEAENATVSNVDISVSDNQLVNNNEETAASISNSVVNSFLSSPEVQEDPWLYMPFLMPISPPRMVDEGSENLELSDTMPDLDHY